MRYRLAIILAFFSFTTFGQGPFLKPAIGLASLPAANAAICPIQTYLGDYITSGYQVNDTIPDFTFYDVNGAATNMHDLLLQKKPVLLIAGSYTCPEFRYKVSDINAMTQYYAGLLNVVVVYVVEAHPDNTICPYTGTMNVTNDNIQDTVLYDQPVTYGERVALADTMNAHLSLLPGLVIDGPCNEWWNHFGPAPNNAYLVDTNGVIKGKNGWYNHDTENMWCSIDSLLGTNSGHCSPVVVDGNFDFQLSESSTVTGVAGDVLTIHGMLKNLSSSASVSINIEQIISNIPAGWETALCTNICLPPNVSTTHLFINPSDSQSFTFYFYTDSVPAVGNVKISFSNTHDTGNQVYQWYHANTHGLTTQTLSSQKQRVNVYPNPATEDINVTFPRANEVLMTLLDGMGAVVKERSCNNCNTSNMDVSELPAGIYMLKVTGDKWNENKEIVIK